MNKNKAGQISEWIGKGAEWCANQLYLARMQRSEAYERNRNLEKEVRTLRSRVHNDLYILERANKIMADVLGENGIRPTRLRITYLDTDCVHCPCRGSEDGEGWDCLGCGEEVNGTIIRETEKEVTESIAFYTYKIDDGMLQGITSHFEESEQYDLLKAVDEKTGEVLGEWEVTKND